MAPEKFRDTLLDQFARGSSNIGNDVYIGGTHPGPEGQHQLALAVHEHEGDVALTVLSANTDPLDDHITRFSMGKGLADPDEHIWRFGSEAQGVPEVIDLRGVPTVLGAETDIQFIERGEPGEYEGALRVPALGLGQRAVLAQVKMQGHPDIPPVVAQYPRFFS